jgi:hypothetical protein
MSDKVEYVVGTSGYSFEDWVGTFYPVGTTSARMLDEYAKRFEAVEVNFTYYRMPTARTIASLTDRTRPGFVFWVKANEATTHQQDRSVAKSFNDAIAPARDAGRLAGILMSLGAVREPPRAADGRAHGFGRASPRVGRVSGETIEVLEAPAEQAAGTAFTKLFEMNISTDRR